MVEFLVLHRETKSVPLFCNMQYVWFLLINYIHRHNQKPLSRISGVKSIASP